MPANGAPARSSLDDYLDRVIADLASRGDDVGIVRLVERWVNAGEPTRYGLIAQARALLRPVSYTHLTLPTSDLV